MNNTSKAILTLMVCALAVLGFRAYKSYKDANGALTNEITIANYFYGQNQQIVSFLKTEFPDQVQDFTSKVKN